MPVVVNKKLTVSDELVVARSPQGMRGMYTNCMLRTVRRIPTPSTLYIFNVIPVHKGVDGEDREARALPKHKGERTGTGIRANSPKPFLYVGDTDQSRWWVSLTSSKPSRGCVSVVSDTDDLTGCV